MLCLLQIISGLSLAFATLLFYFLIKNIIHNLRFPDSKKMNKNILDSDKKDFDDCTL